MSNEICTTVLVTGSAGMIGSCLARELLERGYAVIGIDKRNSDLNSERYKHISINLGDYAALESVFEKNTINRVLHLAALAHKAGEPDLSYDRYYHINVACSRNLFNIAAQRHIPILFVSTADVYGFAKGVVNPGTEPHPVGPYAATKYLAEKELMTICKKNESMYSIFRFAPVYTDEIKRDIQKRYYLKYPKWAYIIGKGVEYEFLHVENAVQKMVEWVSKQPSNEIINVKDKKMMNTVDCLKQERANGRAKYIIHIPRWMVVCGFAIIRALIGENMYSFLLNKAIYPLRTECQED